MKILIYLGHPAHYHTLSHLLPEWAEEGHEPILVARDKDVLLDLIQGLPYRTLRFPSRKGNSWWSIFFHTLKREWKMYRLTLKEKPGILIGTDVTIAHAGYWTGTPSLLINEDDSQAVPKLAHLGFRYASRVLSPHSCDITPYEKKKLPYHGVHELAYLHPSRFTPDPEQIKELFPPDGSPYVLVRVSALTAHHDKGLGGLDSDTVRALLERISPYATPWISSEKELPEDLEPYRVQVPPEKIHHALAHAKLLIGDSQTMTAEAAILGTPSVRYSDLVGRLGYLDELENAYQLTFGFVVDEKERMLEKVSALLKEEKLDEQWKEKRELFLKDSDDPLDLIRSTVDRALKKAEEKRRRGL